MEILAGIARLPMTAALWFRMRDRSEITACEVATLFDGDCPDEALDFLANQAAGMTRKQIIEHLRDIANRNAMGARFAERLATLPPSPPTP